MLSSSYCPSSSEKKTAVLVYLLVGSIIVLHKKKISEWLRGHTQQALGWRTLCVPIAFVSLILVFIPLLSLLPLLLLVAMIGIWIWFVYQLRQGYPSQNTGGLGLFANMGQWITDLMDVAPELTDATQETTE